MNKLNIPSPTNGIPFNWDDLEYFLGQGSYDGGMYQLLNQFFAIYGADYIICGCEESGGTIADGFIFLDGEVLKVESHTATDTYFEKVTSNNSDGNKQTELSGTVDIYQENRATVTASSGDLAYTGYRLFDKYQGDKLTVSGAASTFDETINDSISFVNISYTSSSGSCYIRLPDASDYNKGNNISFNIDYTGSGGGETLYIQDISASVIKSTESEIDNLLIIQSNGTTWDIIVDIELLASIANKGLVELATGTETAALSDTERAVTPSGLNSVVDGLVTKVIDIGDWNMDTTSSVNVAHGVTFSNIREVSALIRNDTDTILFPINYMDTGTGNVNGSFSAIDSTNIGLVRLSTGLFDNTSYDSTSYNRGWIVIRYTV